MSDQRQNATISREPSSRGPSSLGSADAGIGAYRSAMRRLGGAVCVVTTIHNGRPFGLTATAVCSLTADPPRLLACINLSGTSYQLIAESRVMAVNVLSSEHRDLAMSFSRKNEESDLFADGAWTRGATGAPLLTNALSSFDCEVEQMIVTSTHAIVIGDVRYLSYNTQPPGNSELLLHVDGGFHTNVMLQNH